MRDLVFGGQSESDEDDLRSADGRVEPAATCQCRDVRGRTERGRQVPGEVQAGAAAPKLGVRAERRSHQRHQAVPSGLVDLAHPVDVARDRIRPQVRLETREADGVWRKALPADARKEGRFWMFSLPESGVEPLLRALIEGEAGILALSIERAGLHDAFVAIAGEAAARALESDEDGEALR